MVQACLTSSANSDARRLCSFLVTQKRIPLTRIDTGVAYVNFHTIDPFLSTSKPTLSIIAKTKGNGKLELRETYEHAIRILEGENTYRNNAQPGPRSITRFARTIKHFRPPWLLTDFNPRTTWDRQLAINIRNNVDRIRLLIAQRGFRSGTKAFNTKLVHALIQWIVNPQHRGGLGVIPVNVHPRQIKQERSAIAILHSTNRKSHCSELSYIIYEVMRLAGLKPEFLLVYQRSILKPSLTHICVGVRLDPAKPNNFTPIDLTYPNRSRWINTPHAAVIPLPKTTVMSIYFKNKGGTLFNSVSATRRRSPLIKSAIKRALQRAYYYDKTYPLVLHNLEIYYRRVEQNKRRARYYRKALLNVFPTFK